MKSIDNDVLSDRCNEPLFLLSEAAKLAVLALLSCTLLLLAPALDDTIIEAKQSIPSDFISTQLSSFETDTPHQ